MPGREQHVGAVPVERFVDVSRPGRGVLEHRGVAGDHEVRPLVEGVARAAGRDGGDAQGRQGAAPHRHHREDAGRVGFAHPMATRADRPIASGRPLRHRERRVGEWLDRRHRRPHADRAVAQDGGGLRERRIARPPGGDDVARRHRRPVPEAGVVPQGEGPAVSRCLPRLGEPGKHAPGAIHANQRLVQLGENESLRVVARRRSVRRLDGLGECDGDRVALRRGTRRDATHGIGRGRARPRQCRCGRGAGRRGAGTAGRSEQRREQSRAVARNHRRALVSGDRSERYPPPEARAKAPLTRVVSGPLGRARFLRSRGSPRARARSRARGAPDGAP